MKKIFVVTGNPGKPPFHHMTQEPYTAHTSRADAEFFDKCNKILEPGHYGTIKEISLDPPVHKDVIDRIIAAGVTIPDHLKP